MRHVRAVLILGLCSLAGAADDGRDVLHFEFLPRAEKDRVYEELRRTCYVMPSDRDVLRIIQHPVFCTPPGVPGEPVSQGYSGEYQRLSSARWRAFSKYRNRRDMESFFSKIQQAPGGDLYLVDIRGEVHAVQCPGQETLTESHTIKGLAKRDGVFEYESMTGPRRIPKWQLISRELSKSDLVRALRSGQALEIILPVDARCPTCNGHRWHEGKRCDRCRGTGKASVQQELSVEW